MKKILLLLSAFFLMNTAKAELNTPVSKCDTVYVLSKPCPCDKSFKKHHKKTGQKRTKVGSILWDILNVAKELIPLLGSLTR
jgi:hypothetical protein